MKITIESTEKIVELELAGALVPARIWQGHTASGIPVTCFITRISPDIKTSNQNAESVLLAEFESQLRECVPPTARVLEIPLRFIL